MSEEIYEQEIPCSHDCSNCSSNCSSKKPDKSQFAEPMNAYSKVKKVIGVVSGKGGVGKSNTAINLAIWFKKMGQRVIILDADFGLANIEIMFGTVPKHNLCDLLYQGKNITDIITWGPGEVGFISGGSGIVGLSNLSREYLTYIIQNLAARFQLRIEGLSA